jgi:hypothetical protein
MMISTAARDRHILLRTLRALRGITSRKFYPRYVTSNCLDEVRDVRSFWLDNCNLDETGSIK